MRWVYDDGGRSEAGFKGVTGDCCARAFSIATGKPYKEVYNDINQLAKRERTGKRKSKISNARTGVYRVTAQRLAELYGMKWVSVMGIGTGCTMHMREDELPTGTLVLSLSKHYACVKNGVLHDIYDCSRDGTRCVYGYWVKTK